ncbi:pyridoxal 5'-phosphate synthase glutaminase subunit PdxT [Oceanobacillus bengalensis]|uniref:Pyridoxal 5'-phosphate synthase subunit PdxT n=1 Tax=Oceanobacillus bengalensis TaxID=1435466 RepID=A0A494YRE3_9BACI|nr:pyridoxal 5'-phosphate synthase glutaminase subunit PdxT [Oceanobacillus bengalensis]RKQ11838.1 pyridoxal 5'-phosphate synthase glutaminase subunit PdxT [Oceanobacillus bengalensis]
MGTIGVLGLQGAVEEHIRQIEALNYKGIVIKKPEQLDIIDGLILPGGESTTMRKLIDRYGFFEPLKQFSLKKKPIFGTCAGMVLVAKSLVDANEFHLGLMDISVKRNAFGRQKDSFETNLKINGLENPYKAVFIRAPYITSATEEVHVLATYDNHIVAAKQKNILVSAFHPELTADKRFLELFTQMVETNMNQPGYTC